MGWHVGLVVGVTGPFGYLGGNEIRFDGTYTYHTYYGSSPKYLYPKDYVTNRYPSVVDFFMVGGGAGGGGILSAVAQYLGGGGGGQVKYTYGHVAPQDDVQILVGDGGIASYSGGIGYTSSVVFNEPYPTITAVGGNIGGASNLGVGGASGSGNAGGGRFGPPLTPTAGGGGGGEGFVGTAAPSAYVGGDGGDGLSNDWRTGTPIVYGSGGAGGARNIGGTGVTGGVPGDGGGSAGFATVPPVTRGGGGGAILSNGPTGFGNVGGTGIIIVRYLGDGT